MDLLIKVGRSEHVYVENRDTDVGSISARTMSWSDGNSSGNGKGSDHVVIYHALDCLAMAVEIMSLIDAKFTELMSLFVHNLALTKEATQPLSTSRTRQSAPTCCGR